MNPKWFVAVVGALAVVLCCFGLAGSEPAGAPAPVLAISGAVKKPLSLSIRDLKMFSPVTVRLNEVEEDGSYQGAFVYHGVPLAVLLELAQVDKEEARFFKPIDLGIRVRNAAGKASLLSWGEVFYHNPSEIIVATQADPVMPAKSCQNCHHDDTYKVWLSPLDRQVGFPKLVLANDFYGDRSIESISQIEVIELPGDNPSQAGPPKPEKLLSPSFRITSGGSSVQVGDLNSLPHQDILAKQAGEGKGFHGLQRYSGVPLHQVLDKEHRRPPLDSLLLVSAPDGYRSVFSAGEILQTAFGKSILIADRRDGKPIQENGKFILVAPEDLSADRWVKAVSTIEVVQPKPRPMVYIIGVGCGDTALVTLEAISTMAKADVFAATDDLKERFAPYLGGKPVLFDPLLHLPNYFRKKNPTLSPEESQKQMEALRTQNLHALQDALRSGKSIGFLEYGDPTLYGSWTYWLLENIKKEDVQVIPGISAFNAANAMLAKNVARKGSVVITVPDGIKGNEPLVAAVAKNGDTLALFIGLKEMKSLAPLLGKYYPKDTPVVVLYKAGYAKSARLVKTQLSSVADVVEKDPEQFLGIVYIGESLQ